MSDATVLANAKRQAELEARGRDLTKPMPPPGTDGDSLRAIPGMANITDEMLAERASFNLKDHMLNVPVKLRGQDPGGNFRSERGRSEIDLASMTREELYGLQNAARAELAQREGAD
jgi:hypothetical protein